MSDIVKEIREALEKATPDPDWELIHLAHANTYQEYGIRTFGVNREADARLVILLRSYGAEILDRLEASERVVEAVRIGKSGIREIAAYDATRGAK